MGQELIFHNTIQSCVFGFVDVFRYFSDEGASVSKDALTLAVRVIGWLVSTTGSGEASPVTVALWPLLLMRTKAATAISATAIMIFFIISVALYKSR